MDKSNKCSCGQIETPDLSLPEDILAVENNTLNPPPLGLPIQAAVLEQSSDDSYEGRPACFKSFLSECLFVLTTTFAIGQPAFMEGLLMVMSGQIQEGLNMNSSEVTWILAGMSLTSGALLIPCGRICDLFGRRLILIYSMGTYTAFILAAGFSTNPIMAEIFLALAGVSCAAAVPPAIGKLGAIYNKPSKRKNRAFACFCAGNPLGFSLGALIAGVSVHFSTWRTCFWAVAVLYGLFTIAAWFTTPFDTEQTLSGFNTAALKQMDWLGAFLSITGIALFTAAFTLAAEAYGGWKTPYVVAMLVVGVVLITAFLYWQSIFTFPLMPLHVWKDRNFSLLVASLCLGYYGFVGNFFWLCLGWQRTYLNSPLEIAVKTLPVGICGVLVNVVVGLLLHRVSNKYLAMFAAAFQVIASTLLSFSSKSISYWALAFPMMVFSVIGGDAAFCVTNLYVVSALPIEQQSIAGGMFQTATRLATTIGLGVSTTVFAAAGGTTEVSINAPWRPYQATFWVGLVGAVPGLALTLFLTIGKQGHRVKIDAELGMKEFVVDKSGDSDTIGSCSTMS